jgi:putative transposase
MPRKPRVSIVGVPEHIIQRGNNRQVIFASDGDMKAYVTWLKDYAEQFDVAIHAWVLMTNHVHILCTPGRQYSISHMMQALGRKYVQYFNRRYKRSGTLWEGRFRSCLVQDEKYLLQLYRYIELNPVRAGLVNDPADYSWSSYQCNGLGKVSKLLSPHLLYQSLGKTNDERYSAYRELFRYQVDGKLLEDIRNAANKGLVLGSEKFVEEVEALTGKQLKEGKRGRPVGWRKATKSS